MPLWMSILPPLVAILCALLLREVLSSLFLGIFTGAAIMAYYSGAGVAGAAATGLLHTVDTYVIGALNDSDHLHIIVFTMLIGAMVRIVTAGGGMRGIVGWLARRARTARSGQLATFLISMLIFFDDYAATLVVGNTMRPITDRLKISREKLAYLVDSTSAPMVAVAFVTTWIGAELSYIQSGIETIGIDESAYSVFLHSLGFSFYPLLTLFFVVLLIASRRDFGSMLKAERAARSRADAEVVAEEPDAQDKPHAIDALLPILVLIVGTVVSLVATGYDAAVWQSQTPLIAKLTTTIGNANSYLALLWSSLLALLVAIVIAIARRTLKFGKAMEEVLEGFKSMLPAVAILTLAWAIALITKDMHTADFLSGLLIRWSLYPALVPALTFVLAFLIGFSTGTSWGTMAILYPLILPASWGLAQSCGLSHDESLHLFYIVVSTVLSGAVFGDHCSPISDTTIMSSTASGCDHIAHVRTQMPYAITVGAVSLLTGIVPSSLGLPSAIAFLLSAAVLIAVLRFAGKRD